MTEGCGDALRTVEEMLKTFDNRPGPFELHEVAEAARELGRQQEASGHTVEINIRAEWLAFTLMENYQGDESFTWGTYYGPVGVFVDEKGARVEMPPITEITPEVIACWRERATAAHHPLLRMRYADLVWEFGRRAKMAPGPEFPHIGIDATVAAAQRKLFPHSTVGLTALRRALAVALSLGDEGRVIAVRDAIVAYEEAVAEDRFPGTWGVAFDELVGVKSKRIPMPPELVLQLVSDLETRLNRLAHPAERGALPDGFAVEAAALRLARHYRATGDQAGMRRTVLAFGQAFATAAEEASPMLAMAWLERIVDAYHSFGLHAEAEATAIRLRGLGPGAVQEMKPVETSIEIPGEEVEQFLDEMTAGTLKEILGRIATQFIPDKGAVTEQVHRLAKVAPLSAIIPQKLLDREGRVIARIGSLEDDLDGRVVRQTSQQLEMEVPWLHAVIVRMRERLSPTPADLRSHLAKSPVFDESKGPILERGLAAYLGDEPVVAAPVLIPQVEDALRKLLRLAGGSTYKPHRLGGLMLKTLDDLLREELVVRALGENVAHYFRVLFTDQRGWNIRNDVCHGITPLTAFSSQITDRIFHSLLVLALLRKQEEVSKRT